MAARNSLKKNIYRRYDLRGIYSKRNLFRESPRTSYLAIQRPLQKSILPHNEVDSYARWQKEEVYVLPFDEIPGPTVPYFAPSKYIIGPIQQAHSLGFHPYDRIFANYGPLVRVNGDSLLVSHPRYISTILATSRTNRSALSTMERKRRLSLPVRMPEYEIDFTQLSEIYGESLNFKPNHFNSSIEVASDQLISRIYYCRNLQHEVPKFTEELYKWGLQSMFSCLFSKDSDFLQDPTGGKNNRPKYGTIQTFQTFIHASHFLAETEAGPLGRLVRQRSVANHIDVMNGILCLNLRTKYLRLGRDIEKIDRRPDLVEAMILRDKMNSDDILTRLCDIVILGVNIVAHSVGFLVYHLAKNPIYQATLYKEAMEADPSEYHNIDFLNWCIYESMRLRPPFPYLSRDLDHNIVLHGYGIPKGIQVHMINEVANMRKDMFPQPKMFLPERWGQMGKDPMLPHDYQLQPLTFAPLLHSHVSVLVAKLVQHFKFEYHYGKIKSEQLLAKPHRNFAFSFIDRNK